MRPNDIAKYVDMSTEDQRTFDRWLKANLVVGSIFASALCAMALVGSKALEPETAGAQTGKAMLTAMPNYNENLSPYEIMIRMPNLPTQQVKDPF
jgi:hypothetical protein